MKKYFLAVLLLYSLCAQAQNLVPNPSFEDYVNCPVTLSELPPPLDPPISITEWSRPSDATSDYFNSCNTSPMNIGVPNNFAGTQTSRTGNAYIGTIILMTPMPPYNEYREYVQTRLTTPLIAGHRYHVSYWLSRGESYSATVGGVDQMGAYFGLNPEERTGFTGAMDDLIPQVVSGVGTLWDNTTGWDNISGIFTAAGNEEWMILGNFTPTATLNFIPDTVNNYNMYYFYFDDVCVVDMDGVPVSFQVYDSSLCNGSNISINGRENAISYLWNDGYTEKNRTINDAGTYWVKSVDLNNCSVYADTFKIIGIDTVDIDLGNDTLICANNPLKLGVTNDTFTKYHWSTGSSNAFIEVSAPGTYFVSASSECSFGSDTIVVTSAPAPKAQLPQDALLCAGTTIPLINNQPNIINTWSTGEVGCCIEVNKAGTYTLTASNVCGDKATDEINITYSGCDNCILAPTAFSPNGDGLNDNYTVLVNCLMKSYTLKIYNRWGQLIYQSYNPEESWNGQVNGAPAEAGVYFYYLKAVSFMDMVGRIERKGDITLIR